MANPEKLARYGGPDLFAQEDARPIEGKSFENLQRFLSEGAVASLDSRKYYPKKQQFQTDAKWERNLRITYDYVFGEEIRKEIARRNNVTRQAVDQTIKRTLRALLRDSDGTRSGYSFDSFDFIKPLTLATRRRLSATKGGRSLRIAEDLDSGATLRDLKEKYSRSQIRKARIVLAFWGKELKRERNPILPRFEGLRDSHATNQEIQALLDKIDNQSTIQKLRAAGLVVSLKSVARKSGLFLPDNHMHLVAESVERQALPLTKVLHRLRGTKSGKTIELKYYIIATQQERLAIDILSHDRSLDRFRVCSVMRIAGSREKKHPTVYDLQYSGKYGYVGNLIRQVRETMLNSNNRFGVKTPELLRGSSVPVFRTGHNLYYPRDREQEFYAHIESRLRELGLI